MSYGWNRGGGRISYGYNTDDDYVSRRTANNDRRAPSRQWPPRSRESKDDEDVPYSLAKDATPPPPPSRLPLKQSTDPKTSSAPPAPAAPAPAARPGGHSAAAKPQPSAAARPQWKDNSYLNRTKYDGDDDGDEDDKDDEDGGCSPPPRQFGHAWKHTPPPPRHYPNHNAWNSNADVDGGDAGDQEDPHALTGAFQDKLTLASAGGPHLPKKIPGSSAGAKTAGTSHKGVGVGGGGGGARTAGTSHKGAKIVHLPDLHYYVRDAKIETLNVVRKGGKKGGHQQSPNPSSWEDY